MYDAQSIANEFIRRANEQGRPLTHLQVQKLVYFAHARLLAFHRQPLVNQDFEAWEYGPVVPDLYHALKHNDADPIMCEILGATPDYSYRESDIFDWCFKKYGGMSGRKLSKLTHAPNSPWTIAVDNDDVLISDNTIADYHILEWREDSLAELNRIGKIPTIRKVVLESLESDVPSDGYSLEELKARLETSDIHSA